MKTKFNIVLAMTAAAAISQLASADVMVSNLDESTNFTVAFQSSNQSDVFIASKFVTGADMTEVFAATAKLFNPGNHGLATYQAFIYADDGTNPGSLVGSFDTMPTIASGAGTGIVTFESTLGIALDSNTSYWLGIRNITGDYTGWWTTRSTNEDSTAGWSIDDGTSLSTNDAGANWVDYGGAFTGDVPMYSIQGNTIPTPGALALLGTGGLIAARRRRR